MYKKSFLISLFLLVISAPILQAQKIDLDKKKFNVEYTDVPTDQTLSYFDTYSTDFFSEQTTLDQLGLSATTINSYFLLEGYSYTKGEAQFNYSINISTPKALLEGVQDIQQTVTNADGTSKQVTKYIAIVTYSIPTAIYVKLIPYGTTVYATEFSTSKYPTVYKSAPQETRESAQALVNYKAKGINVYLRDQYLESLKNEINTLKQTCSFHKQIKPTQLWEINEKSAPELAPFNKEVYKAVSILEKATYNTPLDNARTEMAPSLKYWSDHAAAISSVEKNQKKLKYANLYNLATCQYHLELYDECIKSCELLIANDYNKEDGTGLMAEANAAKKVLAKSGQTSRHQARPGFLSQEHFEYTPVVLKKPNFIEQNKQDFKAIGNSVSVLGKDIKDDFTPPKITDTLSSDETYFSYIKFTQNDEQIELKGRDLKNGSASPDRGTMHCEALYGLSVFKKTALIPPKEGTVDGFGVNFRSNYKNSPAFNTDSLIALIKQYQNDYLQDISVCNGDSIPFHVNGEVVPSKILLGKDYPKKLAADMTVYYYRNGNEGDQQYMTNNGDSFKITITEVVPVIVKNSSYGTITPNCYLVTMKIPELTLTKIMIGHIWFYRQEYVTLKNIEMRVLVMGSTKKE